jgi:hypothetical protein
MGKGKQNPKWLPTPTTKAHTLTRAKAARYLRKGRSGDFTEAMSAVVFPTPNASRYGTNVGGGMGRTGKVRPSLDTMASKDLWPTPTVQDAANNGGPSQHLRNSKPLNAAAGGALSPNWVEWLMGWPIGWTSLDPLPAADFAEWQTKIDAGEWWRDDPSLKRSSGELVPRTTPGVPNRAKRLRAIGNGQVPSCAALAWVTLCRS